MLCEKPSSFTQVLLIFHWQIESWTSTFKSKAEHKEKVTKLINCNKGFWTHGRGEVHLSPLYTDSYAHGLKQEVSTHYFNCSILFLLLINDRETKSRKSNKLASFPVPWNEYCKFTMVVFNLSSSFTRQKLDWMINTPWQKSHHAVFLLSSNVPWSFLSSFLFFVFSP